jgi:Flp pilus assembly protein TadD
MQKDIELQAQGVAAAVKAGVISAADKYDRGSKTASLFTKGQNAVKNKKYDEASALFRQVVETDPADFPAWMELGTAYFAQKNSERKAYRLAKHQTMWYSDQFRTLNSLKNIMARLK